MPVNGHGGALARVETPCASNLDARQYSMAAVCPLGSTVSAIVDVLAAADIPSDGLKARLAPLSKQLFESLEDSNLTAGSAWNALCLVWHHYETFTKAVLGDADHGVLLSRVHEVGAWADVHKACKLLAIKAAQAASAEQEANTLVLAQLHFDSARVRRLSAQSLRACHLLPSQAHKIRCA